MTVPMNDILKYHQNINKRDSKGRNALFFEIEAKHNENVKQLMQKDISLMVTPKLHALFWAIKCDDFESVKLLIEKGVNVDIRDNEYKTPLMYAAYYAKVDICNFLINSGADLFKMNLRYDMAIDLAYKANATQIRDILHSQMQFKGSEVG